ncbi:hypothetical protein EDD15DRAFT_2359476 [Pisolithus albus]|nr:hypothetical protein EDD15DRAFT_2359476 [Pisolithus albus]
MSSETSPLVTRVLNARNRLMASGMYLANPSIVGNVQWVREGRGHVLSNVAPTTNCENSSDEDTPEETDATETSESTVEDVAIQNLLANPGLPPRSEKAILSAIACIDHDDFWLTPDGGYHGPTTVCREILDVKPSCAMTIPGLEPVRSDFGIVMQNLRAITQKCVTPGYSTGRSFFTWDNLNPTRFKLRHQLFEPLEGDEDKDNEPRPQSPSDDPFSFEKWPLTRERHRPQLLSLKATHRLLPIPAYDVQGNLLKPSTYRRYLQGALVEIHFTLTHWGIAGVKKDVYGGEIELIRILDAPQHIPSPVLKRKLPLHLEADDVPHKKPAIA